MELMITLTVAGILLGLTVPAFRGLVANNRLITQTNDLVAALSLARSEAITRNAPITFCRVESDGDTDCAEEAGDWDFWIIRNADGDVIRSGQILSEDGRIVVTSTFTEDTIVYSPDGLGRSGTPPALLTDAETLQVCSRAVESENIRTVTPGAGSRMSMARSTGACS